MDLLVWLASLDVSWLVGLNKLTNNSKVSLLVLMPSLGPLFALDSAAYMFKSKRVPVSLMLVLAEHVLLGGVHGCWLALSYLNMFHREGKGAGDRYDKEELCDFSVVDHCFTALAVTTKTIRSKFPFRFQSTNRRSNDSSPPPASPPHKFPNHATTAEAVDVSERRFSFERGKTSQNLLSFETIMSEELVFDPEIDAYAMSTLQRSGIDRVLYGAFFLYGLCSNLGAAYEVALCLQVCLVHKPGCFLLLLTRVSCSIWLTASSFNSCSLTFRRDWCGAIPVQTKPLRLLSL